MNIIKSSINLFANNKISPIRFGYTHFGSNYNKEPNEDIFEKRVVIFKECKDRQVCKTEPIEMQENFDVKFIGYDKNCSLEKTLATDRSDWFAGAMR